MKGTLRIYLISLTMLVAGGRILSVDSAFTADSAGVTDSTLSGSEMTSVSASDSSGRYFPLLMVTQSNELDSVGRIQGLMVVAAGYSHGIDLSMSGYARRGSQDSGFVSLATFQVVGVTGNEAVCRYTVIKDRVDVRLSDFAFLRVVRPRKSVMMDRAVSAFGARQYEKALSYLYPLYCADTVNDSVANMALQCQAAVFQPEAYHTTDSAWQNYRRLIRGYVSIARVYQECANYVMADWYISKAYCIDSTDALAKAWRDSIEHIDHLAELRRKCGEHQPAFREFDPIDSIAQMVYYEKPVYPAELEAGQVEGTVWLKVLVGEDGAVEKTEVVRSSGEPALDAAAVEAAPRCRFKAAVHHGKCVAMWVTYEVEFKTD